MADLRPYKGKDQQKTFSTKPQAIAWQEYLRTGVHPEQATEEVGCEESGVTPIGVHGLRHTFATSLVRAGVDVKRVQILLGHSDIMTTMRYVHLANVDLSDVTKCIEIGIA